MQEEKGLCSRASSGWHSCAFSVRQNMEYSGQWKYKKQYSGNTEISEKEEIVHGMSKKKVNCTQLAASVRKDFPDITWVSARITGCKLILDIKEKEELQETEKNSMPCDLVANQKGKIVRIIARCRNSCKKSGRHL